jgi:hypothetical protein
VHNSKITGPIRKIGTFRELACPGENPIILKNFFFEIFWFFFLFLEEGDGRKQPVVFWFFSSDFLGLCWVWVVGGWL